LVGRTANGLNPDYTLMTEIQDFQAEPVGEDQSEFLVRISVLATLIRESDRAIVASRRFAATETVGSDDTQSLVAAFDRAAQTVLQNIVLWTVR
jgi:cholesterol transport system auxiliary component